MSYVPLASFAIVNVPLPPLTATVYGLPLTMTVMFPVASAGVVNVITSLSPTAMFWAVTFTNESHLLTSKLESVVFAKYLSSPSYVAVTLYLPASSLEMLNVAVPFVTFA